jgi:serine/threonine protein kinase
MIGKTIAHFHILEKLGEGGMGVVYKAQDTKLDRVVALKFLPEQATSTGEERARFIQEAKSAATLNHPNVCTIHGIEEHEGRQFIEMEYVDGVTLRVKIPEEGLKLQDAVDYAIQIAEALQEAHSKGIVHRDVKAENVMLNEKNQMKVMDFGLAKLRGSSRLTKTSSTIGTLAYMAPEQIQGEEVDSRSDIFSFGVLLFEMLTGRSPFRGEHEAALVYSIVNEEPQEIQQFRLDVPETIVHLMKRALEKDPDDRYQNMNEIVGELRWAKRQSARVSRKVPVEKPAAEVTGDIEGATTQPVSQEEP